MTGIAWIPLICVALLVIGTIGLGFYVQRSVRSAADLYVASRSVSVSMNSAAISGEYLSAASFMGIAGMVMKFGYDVLWYPTLYAAGYLFLLLFIASPLRRFGAYTIPDFAEGRFSSPLFRKVAVIFVLVIGFFYTMPQMKGAGVALVNILHTPYWVGVVLVGAVITFNVSLGGMKGITFVQAFQYWIKMFAISLPMFILFSVVGSYPGNMSKIANSGEAGQNLPRFGEDTTVAYKPMAPANEITFPAGVTATFVNGAEVAIATVKPLAKGATPVSAESMVTGGLPGQKATRVVAGKPVTLYIFPAGSRFTVADPAAVGSAVKLTVLPVDGKGSVEILYPKGEEVPNAPRDKAWLEPYGPFTNKYGHPLLYTYSLIIAIICGTAGLPHILVRFYTNPDGRTAKRTAFWVLILLGCFYVFPPIWGALGRNLVPQLYAITGGAFSTDSVVLTMPRLLNNTVPYLGDLLSGITSAGAFAGFMTTFSGLLVSITGALAHDIYGNMINPKASPGRRLTAFRISAVCGGIMAIALGTLVENFDINMMVGWAFAIAAASYFPMLIVSVWWRGTSVTGAATGMLGGGISALMAIVSVMLADKKVIPALGTFFAAHPVIRSLAEQPAIWAVPLALTLIFTVSLLTPARVPKDAGYKMLILHAPEELGLRDEYIKEESNRTPVGAH